MAPSDLSSETFFPTHKAVKRGLKCPYPSHWIYPEQFCIEVILARGLSFLERPYNFICFFFDGGSVLMSSSASASVVSGSIARAGLFSTSLTYSAHQASCSASILSSRLICPWWGHHWFQSSCHLSDLMQHTLFFSAGRVLRLRYQVFHWCPFVCFRHPIDRSVLAALIPSFSKPITPVN